MCAYRLFKNSNERMEGSRKKPLEVGLLLFPTLHDVLIFICSTSRTFSFQNQADGESAILIRGNFVLQYKHFDFSKAWFSCSSAISVFRQCCSLQWSQEKKSSSDKLKSETLETSLPTWVCVYVKSSRV